MRISIFESDETLGAIQGSTTLRGRVEAWFSQPVELQAWLGPRLSSNGIHGSVSPSRSLIDFGAGQVLRFTVDLRVNTPAGETREQTKNRVNVAMQIIAASYPNQIWNVGEFTIISRTEPPSGNPDLISQSSTFSPAVNGGNLATVNVPIRFDSDAPGPAENAESWQQYFDRVFNEMDTTTMVLIGLAAVLVLKRL